MKTKYQYNFVSLPWFRPLLLEHQGKYNKREKGNPRISIVIKITFGHYCSNRGKKASQVLAPL